MLSLFGHKPIALQNPNNRVMMIQDGEVETTSDEEEESAHLKVPVME